MAMSQTLTSVWNGVWPCDNIALGGVDIYDCFNFLINHRILSINVSKFQTTPTQTCKYLVSAPDPNPPQHRSHLVSRPVRDTGSDPRWGWFGSGAETSK